MASVLESYGAGATPYAQPAAPVLPAPPVAKPEPTIDQANIRTAGPSGGDWEAGIKGAVSGALFSIPEWIAKQVDRKGTEEYIAKHKEAFGTGELIGSIGSAFIPFVGWAKALGMGGKAIQVGSTALKAGQTAEKAVQLAKAADVVTKAAKAAPAVAPVAKSALQTIAGYAGKGALYGMAEQGVRGAAKAEQGKELESGLKAAGEGALPGAIGGGLGGTIAAAAPKIAKALSGETRGAILKNRGLRTKDVRSAFNKQLPKGAGDAYQAQHAEDYVKDLADFAQGLPPGRDAITELSKESTRTYKLLDAAWQDTYKGSKVKDIINGFISPEDMAKLAAEHGDEAANAAKEFILKGGEGSSQFVGMKKFLQRKHDIARTGAISENVDLSMAVQNLTRGLEDRLEEVAVQAAKKSNPGIDMDKLSRNYRLLKPFEKANIASELNIPAGGTGSPTMEKLGMMNLLSGGAMAGTAGASGDPGEDIASKIARMVAAGIGGYALSKAGTAGMRQVLGKAAPAVKALETAAPKIAAAAPKAAGLGGGIAALAKPGQPEAVQGEPVSRPGLSAPVGTPPKQRVFEQALESGIAEHWTLENGNKMGPPTADNPYYERFHDAMINAIKPNNKLNWGMAANVLYPDKERRDEYLKAYGVKRALDDNLAAAGPALGLTGQFTGAFDKEAQGAKNAIRQSIDEIIKDKSGMKIVDGILNSTKSPAEMKAMLLRTIQKYSPGGYARLVETGHL